MPFLSENQQKILFRLNRYEISKITYLPIERFYLPDYQYSIGSFLNAKWIGLLVAEVVAAVIPIWLFDKPDYLVAS